MAWTASVGTGRDRPLARWRLAAFLAWRPVRLVVGRWTNLVFLSCADLSVSQPVCAAGNPGSGGTDVVLVRGAGGILPVCNGLRRPLAAGAPALDTRAKR
jgi:hypothetical protein